MTSYIGLEPSHGSFDKQLITGDGSTATFTLEFPVAQSQDNFLYHWMVLFKNQITRSISLCLLVHQRLLLRLHQVTVLEFLLSFLVVLLHQWCLHKWSPHIDEFNGDNSKCTFTLTQVPLGNASNFIVFVDNVYQRYGSSYAYTVNGTTLTFTSAPPSGTNNIQVIQLSQQNTLNTVADNHKCKIIF